VKIHKPYFLRAIQRWDLQMCPGCLLANSYDPYVHWAVYDSYQNLDIRMHCERCGLRLRCEFPKIEVLRP
jgi:hypothetical protein